jgi:phosphoglycolate phosphatase-like HAD superfamily hydrolase
VIEQLRPASAAHARVALFDFDGTISVIRAGWMEVMIPMMVEILLDLKTGETASELRAIVEEFVGRLTGKQTMYQMIELAEQVAKRGGIAADPLVYKNLYLELLSKRIEHRLADLRSERADPAEYMVPGTMNLLEALRERGLKMYLASGTDHPYMYEEARLLGVVPYFDGGVYGALDDYKTFSKKILIQRVIASSEFAGHEFLGFGDGYVEIENVREVGGVTVGVASAEPECREVDEWKRQRLIGVGADYIVPNYLEHEALLDTLFKQ